jgi:cell division septation protein DedD
VKQKQARRMVAACAGLAAISTAGCASHAQTAPVYREAAPAGSTEVTVREDFDPARFRQDLLLIQPVFTPPSVVSGTPVVEPDPANALGNAPADTLAAQVADSAAEHRMPVVGAAIDSVDIAVFRVQVIALRREEGARNIADELHRRFEVDADVVPQGRLFSVHAGRLTTSAEANLLRAQIADLSLGYEGAFIIRDTLRTAIASDNEPLEYDRPTSETPPSYVDSAVTQDVPTRQMQLPQIEPELVLVQGFRVNIVQFNDQNAAQKERIEVIKRLKRDDVAVKFEAPWHKVLAGSFRTSIEAQKFVERCRSIGYRTAQRVPGEVYLPREEGVNR